MAYKGAGNCAFSFSKIEQCLPQSTLLQRLLCYRVESLQTGRCGTITEINYSCRQLCPCHWQFGKYMHLQLPGAYTPPFPRGLPVVCTKFKHRAPQGIKVIPITHFLWLVLRQYWIFPSQACTYQFNFPIIKAGSPQKTGYVALPPMGLPLYSIKGDIPSRSLFFMSADALVLLSGDVQTGIMA